MISHKKLIAYKINKLSLIFITITILYSFLLAAQKTGSFSGEVVDVRTDEPVEGAVVQVISLAVTDTTDDAGIFSFDSILVGYYDLDVSAEGYPLKIVPSVSVKVGFNKPLYIEIKQEEKIQELDKMVVKSHRLMTKKTEQSNSVTRLSRDEILNSPGATQDPNKAIQILPCVVGEISPGWNLFLVRGGQDEENIFLIDGIEVFNLSHWGTEFSSGGAISYLHPDFIQTIDFYAGGVPASYPPRLSSVMDITFRHGSRTKRTWQIDMNMAGVGVFLEGPFAKEKSSYMLNGRVSFLDVLEPLIDAGGLPKYQNGQTKVAWDINKKNSLSLNLLAGHETIAFEEDDGRDKIQDEGKHVVGGLRWLYRDTWGSNELLFSGKYNSFDESGVLNDTITYWRWDTKHTAFQLKNGLNLFLREQDIASLGISIQGKKQSDWVGNEVYYIYADTIADPITGGKKYHYFLHTPASSNYMPIDTIEGYYDTTSLGFRFGGYGSYTLGFDGVKIQAGLRNDYYNINKKHGFSPRAAVTVDMKRAGEVSLSSGLYYQFPAYVTRLEEHDDYFELPLQRNGQVVLGYSKQLSDVVLLGTEAYYKYYDKEPLYNVVVPDTIYPNSGYREIDASPDKHGRKKAYGIEFFLQKKRLDRFFYQFSYSLFSVKRMYKSGKWYNDDHNFRNYGKLIIGSNFHKSHRVSLRLDASEGHPYTPIDEDASINSYEGRYDISDGWNSKRRDPRFKLSFRYDMTLYLKRASITSYVEIDNFLNQKDVVVEYYSLGEEFPEGEINTFWGRGILPVGGITITF